MDAMNYETFIRRAFSLDQDQLIGRNDDPASLADTGTFSEEKIDLVKAAIIYSMEIFNSKIKENCSINDDESDRLETFQKKIIRAINLQEISLIGDSYIATVEDKYFNRKDGFETLEPDLIR